MNNYPRIRNRIIKIPIEVILKQLQSELTNGKLAFIDSKSNGWIRISCPHHSNGLEKHPSCGIYNGDDPSMPKGTVHCFTCDYIASLPQFVGECFDKNESFGENWLLKTFETEIIEESPNLTLIPTSNLNNNKPINTSYLDENILNNLISWHPYMAQRKLTPEVCNKFKVKYDPKINCIVFPVWDDKNNLIMLTKRSIETKKFILPPDIEKPIYLMNYIKQNNIKEVTVVESQINALTLWSWGYPAIATFGCNITQHQFDILNKSGIEHYYLAFDGDAAGDKGIKHFINNMKKDVFIDIIKIPKGKDVNDLTEDEFSNLKILDFSSWLLYN